MRPVVLVISFMVAFAVNNAQAAVITNLNNLDINGTFYDVTFHADPASFQSLWDANGDAVVGDGSLGKTPEFWGDDSGALAAAKAIVAALGIADTVTGGAGDGPLVPFEFAPLLGKPLSAGVWHYGDRLDIPADDQAGLLNPGTMVTSATWANFVGQAWTSFSPSASVPLPLTPALLLAGLLAAGVTRRIRRTD